MPNELLYTYHVCGHMYTDVCMCLFMKVDKKMLSNTKWFLLGITHIHVKQYVLFRNSRPMFFLIPRKFWSLGACDWISYFLNNTQENSWGGSCRRFWINQGCCQTSWLWTTSTQLCKEASERKANNQEYWGSYFHHWASSVAVMSKLKWMIM